MGTPKYDDQGYPIPYDDADIKDQHSLFRYIDIVKHDYDRTKGRFASSVFSTSSTERGGPNPGMSTDWKESIETAGRNVFYRAQQTEVVAELNAGFLRGIKDDVKIGQTPDTANDNPHHTDVWGLKNQARKMRDNAAYHLISRVRP